GELKHDLVLHAFTHEIPPIKNSADGMHDLAIRSLLHQIACGTCLQRSFRVERLLVHRNNEHVEVRMLCAKTLDELEAVHPFERYVCNDDVRLEPGNRLECLGRGLRLAAHLEVEF